MNWELVKYSLAGNSYYLVDLSPPASKPPINKMCGEMAATSSLISDGDDNIQSGDDNDDIYGMMVAIAAAPTKGWDICRIFSVLYLLLTRI